MKKENNKNLISKKIISKIKKGEVKMKPRFYFLIKSLLVIGILFLFFLFVIFFVSLIIFVFQKNNFFVLLGMGNFGLRAFILHFPWYLLLIAFILIIVIETVSKKFKFIYRKPLIYSFLFIIIFTFIGSIFVNNVSLHKYLLKMAEEDRLPIGGRMYRNIGDIEMENIYFGKLLEKKEDYWIMEFDDGEIVKLEITEKTRGHRFFPEIEMGSDVVVIGEKDNSVVNVLRFKKMNGYRRNER